VIISLYTGRLKDHAIKRKEKKEKKEKKKLFTTKIKNNRTGYANS